MVSFYAMPHPPQSRSYKSVVLAEAAQGTPTHRLLPCAVAASPITDTRHLKHPDYEVGVNEWRSQSASRSVEVKPRVRLCVAVTFGVVAFVVTKWQHFKTAMTLRMS